MPLRIVRNDITKMQTEAIVNTANAQVLIGAGCDAAIYQAAGRTELLEYRRLHVGTVEEGKSFLTPGFHLPAKYIIHTVSPRYIDGNHGEEAKLHSCYQTSLNLDESKDLLARAGYALSLCDKTDIIFSYFIENEIYDMIELDIQLEAHNLPCLIN